MIVTRTPRFLQQTFSSQRSFFSKRGFEHFRVLVVAIVINARKSKLCHLAAAAPDLGHRTSHARFLLSDWDAAGLLAEQAWRIIQAMNLRRGEPIYLIIDDTQIEKRGMKMDGVSKIWNQKSHSLIHGHVVVMDAPSRGLNPAGQAPEAWLHVHLVRIEQFDVSTGRTHAVEKGFEDERGRATGRVG